MKIGVLGSGIVGRVLGAAFIRHGHEVMLGTRDPAKTEVREWLSQTPDALAGSFRDAARFGQLVVLAVQGRIVDDVLDMVQTETLAGKTVIDTTNPIAEEPPVNGVLKYFTGPNESLGERIQAKIPNAHVVKAFSTTGNTTMVNPVFSQGTPTMFICGNNDEAKAQVGEILRQFGWEPYDCGTITSARAIEPLCMLWCLPGFLRNDWQHALKMLTS